MKRLGPIALGKCTVEGSIIADKKMHANPSYHTVCVMWVRAFEILVHRPFIHQISQNIPRLTSIIKFKSLLATTY